METKLKQPMQRKNSVVPIIKLSSVQINEFLNCIENQQVKIMTKMLGKQIAKFVPFDLIDEAIMALIKEIELNLKLVERETIKFMETAAVVHLGKDLNKGRYSIGIDPLKEGIEGKPKVGFNLNSLMIEKPIPSYGY